jgi:hypothetical protein
MAGAFLVGARFPARRILLGACAASALVSAAALISDVGTDATRWIFAGLFATAVLAFFCTLAKEDLSQTPIEQMASFRVGLLEQEVAAYEASHAQLLRKLEDARGERDRAIAARDAAMARSGQPVADTAVAQRLAGELDAARSRVVALEKELVGLTARIVGAERTGAELDAAKARIAGLEAEALAARGRAEAAETALARAEALSRETQRAHAAELANARAAANRMPAPAVENRVAAAEVEALRARAADAEEAVRTALRELGVDPAHWPATPAGIVRAASPLTLLALGEDVPGFRADPEEDTLAAAVVHLRRQATERQTQLERAIARRPSAR